MLDATDANTIHSLHVLTETVRERAKPIVYWVGAGASAWNGYGLWPQLADEIHSQFSRSVLNYDKKAALESISMRDYPRVFEHCKEADQAKYFKFLVSRLKAKPVTPLFRRFIDCLQPSPIQVVTTNVDTLLESNLSADVVERSDVERVANALLSGSSFVAKIHGSVGAVESMVFTSSEYALIVDDDKYLSLIRQIFSTSSVVFVGYGLGDQYVVDLLSQSHNMLDLFGAGPHFMFTSLPRPTLPTSICQIRYSPEPHQDHRTPISILEDISLVRRKEHRPGAPQSSGQVSPDALPTAHLLFDILPPGTWTTSQTLVSVADDGREVETVIGSGFTNHELPSDASTAMHDLLVGLLCFDKIFAPVTLVARLHGLVGSEIFWRLVFDETISFLHWLKAPAVVFDGTGNLAGGNLRPVAIIQDPMNRIEELIRRQIGPTTGHESIFDRRVQRLLDETTILDENSERGSDDIVRSLLIRPSIRELLGISGGTPLSSLARWQIFPVLRLANLVVIAETCNDLGINSAKLEYGGAELAGPAFAAASGQEWIDEVAGYVLCGRFSANLGDIAFSQHKVLDAVLAFRDSQAGVELRREVGSALAVSEGADIVVAVNGALRSAIPKKVLDEARDEFTQLLVPTVAATPTLWNDSRYTGDDVLRKWRSRSHDIFRQCCLDAGLQSYDSCPCGSGEKIKFCCEASLARR